MLPFRVGVLLLTGIQVYKNIREDTGDVESYETEHTVMLSFGREKTLKTLSRLCVLGVEGRG